MSERDRQLLPGEEGRCSSCGERIEVTEAVVVLHHADLPGDNLYFHEDERCSEPALKLAEHYPEEWSAVMTVPDPSHFPPLPPGPDVCGWCGRRVAGGEPDVVLLHSQIEAQRHRFHEICAWPAYKLVEDDPRTWGLIHRRPDPEAN